ncbi:MAG: electron transport complex subunit RsxC [Clostridia bacterium]|nr:electron transport complex subunit RsxC [Clostridia bacterium]
MTLRFTFRRGIHPEGRKHISSGIPLTDFPTPAQVYISLSQHIGAPAEPTVAVGDKVMAGTLIGKANGFVSANIFSSVSGTVKALMMRPTALGTKANHIEIENDGQYTKELLKPLEIINKESVIARVKEAGIVGMGGATFPTHVKLMPKNPVDTLLINAAECEPYITCDYRLCLEKAKEVVRGTELLMIALGVERAYIGIEDNKPDAIAALKDASTDNIGIIPLVTKYPQGAEKQLIYSILRRKVPVGGLPADIGVVVDNAHTAYAVYDAVDNNTPLYRRAMTVSGLAATPGNFWINTGVTYKEVFEKQEGLSDTAKVISGGPMMGFAQANLLPSVTKGTSSLLFLKESEFNEEPITPCINCARCANACPMRLMPMFIDQAALQDDIEELEKLNIMSCIECGSCSYSCPANRPLVMSIKRAKNLLRKQGGKK